MRYLIYGSCKYSATTRILWAWAVMMWVNLRETEWYWDFGSHNKTEITLFDQLSMSQSRSGLPAQSLILTGLLNRRIPVVVLYNEGLYIFDILEILHTSIGSIQIRYLWLPLIDRSIYALRCALAKHVLHH